MFEKGQINFGSIVTTAIAIILAGTIMSYFYKKMPKDSTTTTE
ncbi:hypothetical protein VB776_16305 [Arcicella sp. DC2W]|uniref:Uncharacterized protein n=1 Tax=Arcicella gelida TaxID=2984195 RepID=A0ABU5S7Q7_9BACT|nr:hypothetical protein [Arcicella sp. DC2W]MEA5404496.1 hypothetical protein [Arcicella sp. DC2W]